MELYSVHASEQLSCCSVDAKSTTKGEVGKQSSPSSAIDK
ncbi:hypothetical protein MNB_SUP05-13-291 [hydrothermal vent metagenome]|uniref:Uncharacterized protein n=1 Tax=hydrothermal vent metagenome TaxID=652676 RepID=A0A1W1DIH0_9ZZZZ